MEKDPIARLQAKWITNEHQQKMLNKINKLKKDLEILSEPSTHKIIQELYEVDFETFKYPTDLKIEETKNYFDDETKFYFIMK
jgi:hypothetical protein